MRQIVNLFLSGLVIWGSSRIFPNDVIVKDLSVLISVTILLWLTTLLVNAIGFFMMTGGFLLSGFGCNWFIAGFFVMALSKVIALNLLSTFMPGFTIKGFWLTLLIAFLCSIFTISGSYQNPDRY